MPKAIETQIAPAIRKYTNIPSKMEEGYEFHELGPSGEVISDPAEFAALQSAQKEVAKPSYADYSEKLKADMGDPYEINVELEARKLLADQEREIFREWSNNKYQFPGEGYLPLKVKKAWGDYRQRLYANAQKVVRERKEGAIKEYEHKLTEYKANETIELNRRQEERLQQTAGKEGKLPGGLTESQAMQTIENLFYSKGQISVGIRQYQDFLAEEVKKTDNIYKAREKAVYRTLEWKQKNDQEEELVSSEEGLEKKKEKSEKKVEKAGEIKKTPGVNAPPEGYIDTGKLQKGTHKKVWLSPDGKTAWVED